MIIRRRFLLVHPALKSCTSEAIGLMTSVYLQDEEREAVGIEPDYLRRGLKRWRDAQLGKDRLMVQQAE